MVNLSSGKAKARIEEGELISYRLNDFEYIHQKGSPGWRNSDTEMFPVIGPTAEAGFRVHVPKGNAIQDQHGLLRELDYELLSSTETTAQYVKSYKAGTVINNSKFPDKSTAQLLIWPFNFEFYKNFELSDKALEISFRISGEKDMPFMLGYHPAFKLYPDNPVVIAEDQTISLDSVVKAGGKALEVADCQSVILRDEKELTIKTKGFGHFMLWTEVPNMICIEPITFYPYAVEQMQLHDGFDYLTDEDRNFKVTLIP
ncbi:MAG: aldose 1-epimerase [Eudoraea sp.]|uniref:aldose 1-epimerase n=1 Tax=Eudoraea sp. TaxID=1979955 RepID=UPI003C75DE89